MKRDPSLLGTNSRTESEERPLVGVKEAARLIGISPFTVRLWLRQRRLAHIRLGSRVLFDPRDLERFVAANRVPAREGSAQ